MITNRCSSLHRLPYQNSSLRFLSATPSSPSSHHRPPSSSPPLPFSFLSSPLFPSHLYSHRICSPPTAAIISTSGTTYSIRLRSATIRMEDEQDQAKASTPLPRPAP